MREKYGNDPLEENKRECKILIQSIMSLPDHDDTRSVKKLLTSLTQLVRIRYIVPPTTEIMVSLQAKKPTLYHATRLTIVKNNPLFMLFQLTGDLDIAEQRLSMFLEN